MKPAFFQIGLGLMLVLGGCAAPFGDETAPGGTREEAVKSADQDNGIAAVRSSATEDLASAPVLAGHEIDALEALRSRVQQDFASAPSLQGHEIIVIVKRIESGDKMVTINARVMKRGPEGKDLDLTDADFMGAIDGNIVVASPYRSEVTAIVIQDGNGDWSTLKTGLLGSRAVEAYVLGQTPDAFEGWAENFRLARTKTSRTDLGQ